MNVLLTILQYTLYTVSLLIALSQVYLALWTTQERVILRNRVVRTWQEKAVEISKKSAESEVTQLFKEAGFPYIDNVRWFVIRFILLVVSVIYFLATDSKALTIVLWIVLLHFATEPLFKYSAIRLLLRWRINSMARKKETELFTLFSLIKTDLLASDKEQVNVYHLINDSLPYFRYINATILRFLNLWRTSPEQAAKVFEQDIGGDTAQFIGDVLARLHNTSRTDALKLISEQGETFSYKRAELALQRAEIQRNVFYTFFLLSAFVGILWFMWVMYSLVNNFL